jgi:DNA-binding CsgD family transcriptional regulator
MSNHAVRSSRDGRKALSDRERDVLRLVAGGHSSRAIGHMLSISAKTVETYKQRVRTKLELSHRSDYVRTALSLGLLGGPSVGDGAYAVLSTPAASANAT